MGLQRKTIERIERAKENLFDENGTLRIATVLNEFYGKYEIGKEEEMLKGYFKRLKNKGASAKELLEKAEDLGYYKEDGKYIGISQKMIVKFFTKMLKKHYADKDSSPTSEVKEDSSKKKCKEEAKEEPIIEARPVVMESDNMTQRVEVLEERVKALEEGFKVMYKIMSDPPPPKYEAPKVEVVPEATKSAIDLEEKYASTIHENDLAAMEFSQLLLSIKNREQVIRLISDAYSYTHSEVERDFEEFAIQDIKDMFIKHLEV